MNGIDQRIDGGNAVLFGDLGALGVSCGGVRIGMTQKGLDMTQAQAALQKMGGKAVAKGMDGDFFLMPHSSTTTFMAF
jgi:hypothetical protein